MADTQEATHQVTGQSRQQIPGTIDMNVQAGDDTAYGLALYPAPSQDPNDPLLWPKWKKYTTLFLVSAYSFFANSSLIGASVYVHYLAVLFERSSNETSRLLTYPNLMFGLGSMVFVPLYHRFGRRPVMLLSLIFYMVGLVGCAVSRSYETLFAFRLIHGFGSSVCEALPAQVVSDVFFIHERGSVLGWYTFALATGTLGALAASYMLAGGRSYNLFFWLEFAVAGALLLGTFLLFEETMYFRRSGMDCATSNNTEEQKDCFGEHIEGGCENPEISLPSRKTWFQQLHVIDKIDHESPLFMMVVRSFTYLLVPSVFWVCSTYGMVIGVAALAFTSTFPGIVAAPPYSWPIENTGLVSVAAFVGYLAAAGLFSRLPDRFAVYLTRRNDGIREAEHRLWCLIIVFFVAPASSILYGYTAENQLHWSALLAAVGMFQFGSFFYMTYTLAYALDSYEANIPEMLIAINVGKQSISFGFGFAVINWITQYGYITVFAVIFCGVLTLNNVAVALFLAFGRSMRTWFAQTWLAKLHRESMHSVD